MMQRTLVQKIDALLYRRGFALADARKLLEQGNLAEAEIS